MERSAVGFTLIATFAIVVLGVAASSIHSAPIQSGFGVEGGSEAIEYGPGGGGGSGGTGGGGILVGAEFTASNAGVPGSGSTVSLIVLAALACVAVAGIALVFWMTGDDADPLAGPGSTPSEPTDSDEERLEEGDPIVEPTNEVYRAWWEMARRTEVSQATSRSPAEFATAAVEAGMNPDAVTELTRLFRGVRYGGASITDETERRATAVLDRIRTRSDSPDPETGR